AKEIPYPKRQNKKLPQTLSNEEIETIINYNRPEKVKGTTKKWRLLFHFLAKTGCRSSEVCKLNVEDVDFAQGLFTLKNTKTRVDRIVPIPPDMHKILEHWVVKERNAKPTDSLFPSAYGKARLTHTNIWAELRERVKQLGLRKNITTHHFRHSFVTELLRQDVSVAKVAQIVGHLHLTTTQMYTHLVIDDLKDAMSRHPLIKKHRDPREILIDLKEKIKGFKLADDPRFDYKISETSTSVSINIRLRKYPSENQSRNR
ncbi:MAG: tyrosine-type recombinase/integrase, partial [Candidatus Cloacimonetes bacterium]|nr:tyrosine-type recombinase/integrase [Candidatus Cloacimonadota bacterium]